MKRFVPFIFLGMVGAVAAGCPIYSDKEDAWCTNYHDCQPGEDCYQWECNQPPGWGGAAAAYYVGGGAGFAGHGGFDAGGPDGGDARPDAVVAETGEAEVASPVYCANPRDCGSGATCGPDGRCHAGDCSVTQCINGFVCELSANGQVCNPADPGACTSDAQCGGTDGCINGTCVAASWLCSDRTQCLSASACVDGKCVAKCGAGDSCPDGYLCRKESGLCDIVKLGCAITADCGSPYAVCVNHACVPRCSVQGPCGEGLGFCVNNGCIPSQKIVAQCAGEGSQSTCADGQICLHHHCYTSCAGVDGGVGECTVGPDQDVCRTVGGVGGPYDVCGSLSNLGSECDWTASTPCPTGLVCIDGFCKQVF